MRGARVGGMAADRRVYGRSTTLVDIFTIHFYTASITLLYRYFKQLESCPESIKEINILLIYDKIYSRRER